MRCLQVWYRVFFGELAWSDFITVFLMLVLVYLFAYGFIRGLLTKSLTGKRRECLGEPLAAITVLSLLTAIYAVFCTIQIVYLFFTGRDASGTDDMGTVCASGIFPAAGSLRD